MSVPVTITVDAAGNITANPDPAPVTPSKDPNLIWTLTPAFGWCFSSNPPGIVCDTNPPVHAPPYTPWTTAQPTPGPGPNQYQVTVPPLAPCLYKYTVNIENTDGRTNSVDPDIETQPTQTPGGNRRV